MSSRIIPVRLWASEEYEYERTHGYYRIRPDAQQAASGEEVAVAVDAGVVHGVHYRMYQCMSYADYMVWQRQK